MGCEDRGPMRNYAMGADQCGLSWSTRLRAWVPRPPAKLLLPTQRYQLKPCLTKPCQCQVHQLPFRHTYVRDQHSLSLGRRRLSAAHCPTGAMFMTISTDVPWTSHGCRLQRKNLRRNRARRQNVRKHRRRRTLSTLAVSSRSSAGSDVGTRARRRQEGIRLRSMSDRPSGSWGNAKEASRR